MARESNENPAWIECKRIVRERDHNLCRACIILKVGEARSFLKLREGRINIIQCAHHHPVSIYPEMAHDPNNVFCLCERHHKLIDGYKSIVDGHPTDEEEHEAEWQRIIIGLGPF